MNAFIIDLRCARFIYCATLVRAFSFCEAFLHKEATWSSKRKLLLKRIPSSFWFELLLIVSFLTLENQKLEENRKFATSSNKTNSLNSESNRKFPSLPSFRFQCKGQNQKLGNLGNSKFL